MTRLQILEGLLAEAELLLANAETQIDELREANSKREDALGDAEEEIQELEGSIRTLMLRCVDEKTETEKLRAALGTVRLLVAGEDTLGALLYLDEILGSH